MAWSKTGNIRGPAFAPSSLAGSLSADVTISGLTTIFTTGTLAAGTWLVTVGATATSTQNDMAFELVVASGTATLSGQTAFELKGYQSTDVLSGQATALVTVTAAATLLLNARTASGGTVKAATNTYSYPGATGWTAVKIA